MALPLGPCRTEMSPQCGVVSLSRATAVHMYIRGMPAPTCRGMLVSSNRGLQARGWLSAYPYQRRLGAKNATRMPHNMCYTRNPESTQGRDVDGREYGRQSGCPTSSILC